MANIYVKIELRHIAKNGTAPLRIWVSHNNTTTSHLIGLSLLPSKWSEEKKCAIGKGAEGINRKIEATLYEWRLASLEVATPRMTATKLKEAILHHLMPEDEKANTFYSAFCAFIDKKEGRTKEIYKGTLEHLQRYDKHLKTILLDEITPNYLDTFNSYLTDRQQSINTKSIHFRNIRAVFNFAIDNELTNWYPFRKFKIKTIETAKRALSLDDLRTIWHFSPEPHAVKYLDMFKLIFLLIGINIIDLTRIHTINNGRIEYNRAKTSKLYSIKVEPEALEIIQKYTDGNGHIDFMPGIKSHTTFGKKINQALQRLGAVERRGNGGKKYFSPMFPNLTTYWARHTWATIAAELDIPNETIAAALGHSYGNRTTNIYINFNQKKVDEANRRVIDYVLYGKR